MITWIAVHSSVRRYRMPIADHEIGRLSAIPTTGHGPANTQIESYSDRTTRFSRTGSNSALMFGVSPNRDERAGNHDKKRQANPGADRKKYTENIQYTCTLYTSGPSTRPLIVRIYTVRSAPLCTGAFLYIAGRRSTI